MPYKSPKSKLPLIKRLYQSVQDALTAESDIPAFSPDRNARRYKITRHLPMAVNEFLAEWYDVPIQNFQRIINERDGLQFVTIEYYLSDDRSQPRRNKPTAELQQFLAYFENFDHHRASREYHEAFTYLKGCSLMLEAIILEELAPDDTDRTEVPLADEAKESPEKSVVVVNRDFAQISFDGEKPRRQYPPHIVAAVAYMIEVRKSGKKFIDRKKLLKKVDPQNPKKAMKDLFKHYPPLNKLVNNQKNDQGQRFTNSYRFDIDVAKSRVE
ncbi:MAG: hypothetical protein KOO62_09155 [candidate division Zixibacteria bacterium]|nr:hypothetical protein [candidate division Zixibacteria bacterium]